MPRKKKTEQEKLLAEAKKLLKKKIKKKAKLTPEKKEELMTRVDHAMMMLSIPLHDVESLVEINDEIEEFAPAAWMFNKKTGQCKIWLTSESAGKPYYVICHLLRHEMLHHLGVSNKNYASLDMKKMEAQLALDVGIEWTLYKTYPINTSLAHKEILTPHHKKKEVQTALEKKFQESPFILKCCPGYFIDPQPLKKHIDQHVIRQAKGFLVANNYVHHSFWGTVWETSKPPNILSVYLYLLANQEGGQGDGKGGQNGKGVLQLEADKELQDLLEQLMGEGSGQEFGDWIMRKEVETEQRKEDENSPMSVAEKTVSDSVKNTARGGGWSHALPDFIDYTQVEPRDAANIQSIEEFISKRTVENALGRAAGKMRDSLIPSEEMGFYPIKPTSETLTHIALGITDLTSIYYNEIPDWDVPALDFYVDVSGSMAGMEGHVVSLVNSLRAYIPGKFYAFGTYVVETNVDDFGSGKKVPAGGGTNYDAIIEHTLGNKKDAICIITDGESQISDNNLKNFKASKKRMFVVYLSEYDRNISTPSLAEVAEDQITINIKGN